MFVDDFWAFFEAERRRPRLRGLAIITAIACVPLTANLVLVTRTPRGDQPVVAFASGTTAIEAPAFTLLSVLLSFATAFVFWLLYAGIAYAITAVFDGEGAFTRYAALLAWGTTPGLFVQFVWLAALVSNATSMTPPADPSGNAAWIEAVQSGPAMAAVDVLYPAALLVAFGLWTLATAVGRRVDTWQAAVAVFPALVVELGAYYVFVAG